MFKTFLSRCFCQYFIKPVDLLLFKNQNCFKLPPMPKLAVRFAPSPTGYLHVGSLRTALYNYLLARQNGGLFILRVEDTDQKRYVSGAVEGLIKTLDLMGMDYDEGPFLKEKSDKKSGKKIADADNMLADKIAEKGSAGPYLQSQRTEIYQKYAQELLDNGLAYYCFCDAQTLEHMRQEQEAKKSAPRYDGRCRDLSPKEIQAKIKAGKPYVIRLKIPTAETITFKDEIRGEVSFNTADIDDQVLIKSDGFPTYHLANVVDDHLMGVNLVIRGEEWLPSTPKHLLLYRFFEWTPPKFAHLPLILNPDKSKLSKRQGDVAVEDYLNKGYLPAALINFIAFLGWNPGDEREIFSLEELVKEFSLDKVGKSGAVFNLEKLDWLNGHYVRQMSAQEIVAQCLPYFEVKLGAGTVEKYSKKYGRDYLAKIILLQQERLKKLGDATEDIAFFLTDKLSYPADLLIWKKTAGETPEKRRALTAENLAAVEKVLANIPAQDFTLENLNARVMPLAAERGVGDVMWPLRVALSGQQNSPGPLEIAAILGQERTLERIKKALAF